MKLVTVDPKNKEQLSQIQEFTNHIEKDLEVMSFVKGIEQEHKISNNIQEMVISVVGQRIQNLGMIQGTRDNKLVELKIQNLKDGNNEKNREFIHRITEYSFQHLGAETLVIFSNYQDMTIESEGYESLGCDDGLYTYVKDREKIESTGRKSK